MRPGTQFVIQLDMDDLKVITQNYQTTAEARDLLSTARTVLLVGPAGSGKNTLEHELIKTGKYKQIVTHTARLPRSNHGVMEKNGVEYFFITKEQALDMLQSKQYIEVALTHGNIYGTSIDQFKEAIKDSKIAVADIDIKGVRTYLSLTDHVIPVFLLPPSFEALMKRLLSRYGIATDQKDIRTRLHTALNELNEFINTDYYYPVINSEIARTTKIVEDIVAGKIDNRRDQSAVTLARQLLKDIKDILARP